MIGFLSILMVVENSSSSPLSPKLKCIAENFDGDDDVAHSLRKQERERKQDQICFHTPSEGISACII